MLLPISRRSLLGSSGALLLGSIPGARVMAQSTPIPANFTESPLLGAQVMAGSLPPVQDRLPREPMVVQPVESQGVYGGVWRTALIGGSDTAWLEKTIGYENLVRWNPDWSEVFPNIASAWEISADARQYTFTLRAGMKWSDGQPFGADDIVFYVDDVYRNNELTSSLGNNPHTVSKIDDLTFTILFEQPNGLFLQNLATGTGSIWTQFPKHYLQQFHKTYNTDNLDQLIQQSGAADWVELFRTKGSGIPGTPYSAQWQNPGLPHLRGWTIVEPYGDTQRVTASRNPFYWKVDSSGQQLPYIDDVHYGVVQDAEVLLLQATNGDIDMHARHINTDVNKSVLAENQESGQYHFFDMVSGLMNKVTIALNLTHKDPILRTIFQNLDFRIGLSHAINRQEIIDAVYVSQGEPWQLAPRPEAPFFNELLAKQYTEYDVDLANEYLDKVLPNKDGSGARLRSDGQKLTILVEVSSGGVVAPVDEVNMVVAYWQAVGIDAQIKTEDRSLLYLRKDANDHDCVVWQGAGALTDALLDPRWYMPYSSESNFAPAWYVWYQQPSNATTAAEEPPEAVQQQYALYDTLSATTDPATQNGIFAQILQIAQEQFYAMGISLPGPGYGIVKNNFRNVPASMPDANLYMTPGPTNPEQYFISEA